MYIPYDRGRPPGRRARRRGTRAWTPARTFNNIYVRSLLGWLETRLAQLTSNYLRMAQAVLFNVVQTILRKVGGACSATVPRACSGRSAGTFVKCVIVQSIVIY